MTRAFPVTRSPARAVTALSAPAATNTGAQAVRPGALIPPVGGATARKITIPPATVTAPIPSPRVSRRPCRRAMSGSANSTSSEASGWTRASGPNARARARMRNDSASRPIPASQRGRRARSSSSRGCMASSAPVARATVCWTRAATAKQNAASKAATTAITVVTRRPPFSWPARLRTKSGAGTHRSAALPPRAGGQDPEHPAALRSPPRSRPRPGPRSGTPPGPPPGPRPPVPATRTR